ncbi:major facilitator superfamily domain-containing protein [Clohesyomyces aquaticus]|uniref:Major facilitator superfamily domain-containing protein n=1 Tax=Clohesyomyces aquaticus TaxID=1231657 RepID=A0A1Y1ZEH9_9PLEO|nr:major facilitator superfamily domain-containing protein [Clohesyomyces aquaticus]
MSRPGTSTPSLQDSVQRKTNDDLENQLGDEVDVQPKEEKSVPDTLDPFHPSQFPDGGRDAWLCLIGTFCCLFCSFGWLNCVGVFQSYYQTHQLSQYSPSTIAWISSCQIFVMFLPGPIVGFVYDNHGPRYLLLFGTFFHVFGLMMTSLCTEYWQFFLAQGICSPLGLNCIFTAATSSVTTWFLKKRGAAYGMMAAGSGLGGVIFPIMTQHLVPRVGYGWTIRICAFLILGMLVIAFLTVKSRLEPRPRKFKLEVLIEPFRDNRFLILTFASFLFFLGLFVPINFIEVQALKGGMSTHLAGYLIPILNAGSIFGRIIPGIIADKVGRYNMQMLMSFFAGILVLAISLPATGNAAFIVFSALYGFASGAFVSLAPAQIAFISKIEQIGVRTGMCFSLLSFAGLAGSPIAGAIVKRNHGDFDGMAIFAGVMLLAGAVMFVVTRMVVAEYKMFVRV